MLRKSSEAQADNYGLNVSQQPDGFAQAALHLSEYRKMSPGIEATSGRIAQSNEIA